MKPIKFIDRLIECPKNKAMCLMISLDACHLCEYHKGIIKLTEMHGVEIFDVICALPVHRRAVQFVKEISAEEYMKAIEAGHDSVEIKKEIS